MAEAFVITCNDSVEHVVIGTITEAEQIKDELAREYYKRNENHWQDRARQFGTPDQPYTYYRRNIFWAARATPFRTGEGIVIHTTGVQGG